MLGQEVFAIRIGAWALCLVAIERMNLVALLRLEKSWLWAWYAPEGGGRWSLLGGIVTRRLGRRRE